MATWITALKVFNEGKPSWCIPRKGTADYETIKRKMGGKTDSEKPHQETVEKKMSSSDWSSLHEQKVALERSMDKLDAEIEKSRMADGSKEARDAMREKRKAMREQIDALDEKMKAIVEEHIGETYKDKAVTKEDYTPDVVKNLKVGDKITVRHFRSGDGRYEKVEHQITGKKGKIFEAGKYDKFTVSADGWVKKVKSEDEVVAINGVHRDASFELTMKKKLAQKK